SSLLMVACCKKLLKQSLHFSIFLSTILVIGFLFFGVFQDFLLQLKKLQFLSNTFVLLAGFFATILLLIIFIRKKEKNLITANWFLIYLFSVLITLEAGMICFKFLTGRSIAALTSQMIKPIELNNDSINK